MPRKHDTLYPRELIERVIQLKTDDYNNTEIAIETGLTEKEVRYILYRWGRGAAAKIPEPKLPDPPERYWKDPIYFAEKILEIKLWEKQKEILEALRDHKRVSVRSGYGVGKSTTAAIAVLWFMEAFDSDTLVISTAPSFRQVIKILWGEIHRWWRPELGGKLFKWEWALTNDRSAFGMSTNRAVRWGGFHAQHRLLVIDEAGGIDDEIFDIAEDRFLTTEYSRILAIGNPPETGTGRFVDTFDNPNWYHIHISCYDCPNVKEGKIVIPGLVTKEWVENMKERWGARSPQFMVRVLGELPPEHFTQRLLTRDTLKMMLEPKDELEDRWEYTYFGVDVARGGEDVSVVTVLNEKNVILNQYAYRLYLDELAERIEELYEHYDPLIILVDAMGLGGGLIDILSKRGLPVKGFMSSYHATEPAYKNLRAQAYFLLQRLAFRGQLRVARASDPYVKFLRQDLEVMEYKYSKDNKILILPKDAIRKKLHRSPDYADSLVIALWAKEAYQRPTIGRL